MDISFGKNRSDTNWKVDYLEWAEFVEILKKNRVTSETMADYDNLKKDDKDKIKNGRAFVGGFVKTGRRKKENVENRWLITLDADSADDSFLFMIDLVLGDCNYAVYSTHSSRPKNLKYRLVIPVNRPMAPDEYAAVSRKIAQKIGMDFFDKTTFDVHRLMYLPSCSVDATPELILNDGALLAADSVLGEYVDWKNSEEWPRHKDAEKQFDAKLKKLGDPTDKPGVIGTFCEVYGMIDAIDKFLSGVYIPTQTDDRWTFAGGSSFGGMRVYDNAWSYSEHQSDPSNDGHCHNAFDLVRIHKFGPLDDNAKEHTAGAKLPSHKAMLEFAASDTEVKKILIADAKSDFKELVNDEDWESLLTVNPKTRLPEPTSKNAEILLRYGDFKNVLAYDEFANTEVIRGDLPWRKREYFRDDYEPWLGSDDNRLMHRFGADYEFRSKDVIRNAFVEVTRSKKFHPIKEYIESFVWDGVERVERIFIDFLGAANTHYIKQVTRKMFLAAVKRLYMPGCKFDEMLVLIGPQGVGKSSLLAKLGRKWFSDSLKTFESKEASEHLQSAWLFEIGELSAMKKTASEEVKAFLSKTEDRYRVAFDRIVTSFPRKCIFFGTTNTRDFLKDTTGNRRFWPVDICAENKTKDHWTELSDEDVGQIWAEVLCIYRSGESLELDSAAKREAERQQSVHMESDPREGIIQEWLDSPPDEFIGADQELRDRVCAAQIWIECLGNLKGNMTIWDAKNICDIMRRTDGWVELKTRRILPKYGKQTVFERQKTAEN